MADDVKGALEAIRRRIGEHEREIARLKTAEDVLMRLGSCATKYLFTDSSFGPTKGLSDVVREALAEFQGATTAQVIGYVLARLPNAKRASIRATLSGRRGAGEFILDAQTRLWSINTAK